MHCPTCHAPDTRVVDSRLAEEGGSIRRRRMCSACSHRFTTYERAEEVVVVVVKSHGGREPFNRNKVRSGISAACKGREAVTRAIEEIVDRVEDRVRAAGPDVASSTVGAYVLDELRAVDEVGYLRFASVYKNFDGVSDFQRELSELSRHLGPAERIG